MASSGLNHRLTRQAGQASVSFVAIVPVLLLGALVLVQVAVVGWTAWSAAGAARAGARADLVGAEVKEAALAALPEALAGRAQVREGEDLIRVSVKAPRLVPLGPAFEVGSRAALDPTGGG